MQGTQPSAEALAAEVLAAFELRDEAALAGFALNESEFRDHVWPELPAARPERNLPFSYVWGELRQKSSQSLRSLLAQHGGRDYSLVSIRFEGGEDPHETYVVHRDTVLTVRTANGAAEDVRLFGSALEKNGAWKVFSYVVDE